MKNTLKNLNVLSLFDSTLFGSSSYFYPSWGSAGILTNIFNKIDRNLYVHPEDCKGTPISNFLRTVDRRSKSYKNYNKAIKGLNNYYQEKESLEKTAIDDSLTPEVIKRKALITTWETREAFLKEELSILDKQEESFEEEDSSYRQDILGTAFSGDLIQAYIIEQKLDSLQKSLNSLIEDKETVRSELSLCKQALEYLEDPESSIEDSDNRIFDSMNSYTTTSDWTDWVSGYSKDTWASWSDFARTLTPSSFKDQDENF